MTTTATRVRPVVRADVDAAPGAAWRSVLIRSDATVAHAPEWLSVIRHAYRHDPLYLRAEDEEGRAAVLPAFIVRRPLLGSVVSSMPFLDTGGPCGSSVELVTALLERLVIEAARVGAGVVEIRCTRRLPLSCEPSQGKVGMTLRLAGDSGQLWRRFDGSVRSQIRKAERSGLAVEFGGVEKLASFYDAFAVRMRDLGSPVHALPFLRGVMEVFGDRARIALIRKSSTTVGGLVALTFKDRLVVPWAACLTDYFSLCPNMLLYWETLRYACSDGIEHFDFGRSSRDSGTYRFKRQWGAEEEPLFWYTFPVSSPRAARPPRYGRAAALLMGGWRRLPVGLSRRIGPPIRRYLTQ